MSGGTDLVLERQCPSREISTDRAVSGRGEHGAEFQVRS